ncbi:MAG TPA: zf-TFIIB domain-containing protein [Terriglobia bacterium]|nr:zf-TFIIB domain-containing protein [Terriglobia bacterium]
MNCPNCSQEMTAMTLEGRQGREVAIDLCPTCQAFWFDRYESLQLSAGSTLQLLKTIGERSASGPRDYSGARCPRCAEGLRLTYDMQRSTRFSYFRCVHDHGRFIRFFEFLREKDFIRPLNRAQIEELRKNIQIVNCSSCGASIDLAAGSVCAHCKAPISILDMKQPQALLAELREAAIAKPIDPALPLELARARRDVEVMFDDRAERIDWSGEDSSDLVHACLHSVARWLARSGLR